jgi:FdhE protein
VTADAWLTSHPYLQGVADLHAIIERAASGTSPPNPTTLSLDEYRDDFLRGVPLLHSSAITIDWMPVEKSIQTLVETLASSRLPGNLSEETQRLCTELCADPDGPRRVVAWLLLQDDFVLACPGLLRYLGWTAMSRYLRPVMDSFDRWRDEDQWLRSYCPTCGSLPAMSQLIGVDQGRRRLLCCGCCGTRWQYRRTRCPFCENAEDDRLGVLTVEGESGLRIDYCKSCQCYLKTYAGEGSEAVLLADWTSIHLDVVACDRGLKRLAASLYELNLKV